ncbi:MAG: imidazole glycerol phosphate synthase subunit HisH [Dictyoglomus sp.]|nr:imidazole glycerol phosphate synthase subunit HisH [Dictyoglomus sp.]MCX7941926.1 imidazole glycerol phosphate synthase subunit HisH [Dictyoglomaceae bacterium]MDW8188617.1 imidazole glycerol phosphate synthase subunit HisH [Dictyoglomus sp.]
MIVIIDYGGGNLFSILKALDFLKVKATVSSNPRDWEKGRALIFPGQGSFSQAINSLREGNKINILKQLIKVKPYLGICLGMQILFEESEEAIGKKGLNLFSGKVLKLKSKKLPHLGWNQVKIRKDSILFKGIKDNSFFYFVHSYYVDVIEKDIVVGETFYDEKFPSVIEKDSIFGVQFHPEKSSFWGLKLLKNFLDYIYDYSSCN